MRIIGLCGGSGAGKGEVCRLFEKYSIPCVDTDAVSRAVMQKDHPCYNEVVGAFGQDILDENGDILRKKLASIIYADKEKKEILERITHRHIINACLEKFKDFEKQGYEYAIADAPLLFESGMDKMCHKTVAVIADEEIRINRIICRDNITRDFAIERIKSQLSREELEKRCDFIIYNNSDLTELEKAVRKTANEIKI